MKDMPYLYSMVSNKLDDLIKKNRLKGLDMETVKRELPNKMRMTRGDVVSVMEEMRSHGILRIKDGKVIRHGKDVR